MQEGLTRQNERIVVRPFRLDDAKSFFTTVRESIGTLSKKFTWARPDYSIEDAISYIANSFVSIQAGVAVPLGIFSVTDGNVIGSTGVHGINAINKFGNLGYWVGEPYRNQGIAKEAAKMVADIGFNDLGLTRLEIVARVGNAFSQKVATSLGAKLECIARNRLYENGMPVDANVYSLIPTDII